MVHQFPTNPTARVCQGLMLRRRACHDGTRPVPQVRAPRNWPSRAPPALSGRRHVRGQGALPADVLMACKPSASQPPGPPVQALRRQIEALLRGAMEDDSSCDCGTGWKALAELQYENRSYPEAYETGGLGSRAGGGAGRRDGHCCRGAAWDGSVQPGSTVAWRHLKDLCGALAPSLQRCAACVGCTAGASAATRR